MALRASVLLLPLLAACASPAPQPQVTPPASAPAPPVASAEPTAAAPSPCAGPALNLLAAIARSECRIDEQEADRLQKALDDPQLQLGVTATRTAGRRVRVRIINRSDAAVTLPLFVHSDLDAFPTRANGRPLAPPHPEWPAGFAYDTGRMLAKVTLPPHGYAEATIVIDQRWVSISPGSCPPNAKCPEAVTVTGELDPGDYRLHVKTPLYTTRADLVAHSTWSVSGLPKCPQPKCKPGEKLVPGCPGGMRPDPRKCPPPSRCAPVQTPVRPCPPVP